MSAIRFNWKGPEVAVALAWQHMEGTYQLLGLLVGDGRSDNDVVTWNPVDGGGDTVLVTGLEGVKDTEDLGGVTAGGGWVGEDETDLLLGVNDEDGADGESNALGVDVGSVLVVDPAQKIKVRKRFNFPRHSNSCAILATRPSQQVPNGRV